MNRTIMPNRSNARRPRTVHLKPGDYYTMHGSSYFVPSEQMVNDIIDTESGKDVSEPFSNIKDLLAALKS